MVYRIYVEKKKELANEAKAFLSEIRLLPGTESITNARIFNRYDAEGLSEDLFREAVRTVFSEPQLDLTSAELPTDADATFAVEYLPGQFDQRADSAAQCIQILSCKERPVIRTAKIYLLYGKVDAKALTAIKKYVINPVEAREASFDLPKTLTMQTSQPETVPVLSEFRTLDRAALADTVKQYGLAMDVDDLAFCQTYFKDEGRDPTMTELRMIDTYWSDHCRHTTFLTTIDQVTFSDELLEKSWKQYLDTRKELGRKKPINLMDIATLAAKYLKKAGKLPKLDESEEINACTVKMKVNADGKDEDWLLLFKNETHNHPTEIEPFGGAATCIGGAIRDPLSGRSYVYGAMRVTGASDPTEPIENTIPGKLPQKKLVQTAAAGYSSYGNQIGLATGIVDEIFHPGYAAKHMEIGAVIAATPADHVRREVPAPGDAVILLGGRTGRDGIGGATGSSKAHDSHSVETCGAEVQKGNAPEERKLQRLFRRGDACRLIKRCNDFGAGGVSVAVGELADGLAIDLDKVPKKYEGLDGTELAISESQERMAVVVEEKDVAKFLSLAAEENLEATVIAHVSKEPRLCMYWKGKTVVDISREFLNSNGAEKHITVSPAPETTFENQIPSDFADGYHKLLSDLSVCSRRGLSERFDSTIGAGTVLMPFGGKFQRTPIQAMVQKIPLEKKHTDTCSFLSYGYDPRVSEKSPYRGAYLAVIDSISKLIATGASFEDVYLTFQEYFPKTGKDPTRWGQPLSALLGASRAQIELGIAAIGGKDSMSGSFESLDVPPTLVSFAVTTGNTGEVISNDLKQAGNLLVAVRPEIGADGLPMTDALKGMWSLITAEMRAGKVSAGYAVGAGGIAEAVYKMAIGNRFGFAYDAALSLRDLFALNYGTILLEMNPADAKALIGKYPAAYCVGKVTAEQTISLGRESISLAELDRAYEGKLEQVYPTREGGKVQTCEAFAYSKRNPQAPAVKCAKPRVLIPVFPGTNCEFDSAKAMADASAEATCFVINNLTSEGIANSAERFAKELSRSQMVFIPGGFSGGDEPDGSGKFIMAFFRNAAIREEVGNLLDRRDGLMCGICNGFQALIKLGLVPYGKIVDTDESSPTLTYNTIARHQSKLVRVRVASVLSPWMKNASVGEIYTVPISHGEGRFLAPEELIRKLAENGQIATQYVDMEGDPTDDIRYNPNGSMFAIEGITSPDGRVFGRMGHSERVGSGLYRNVPGNTDIGMFRAAVEYFKQ